jgi:hypothetical protein
VGGETILHQDDKKRAKKKVIMHKKSDKRQVYRLY